MAIRPDFIDSYPFEGTFTQQLYYLAGKNYIAPFGFFSDLYIITNEQYRTYLLEQTGYSGSNNENITQLTDWVKSNAAAVTATTEDEKWKEFLTLFPNELQRAIQIIVDHEIVYTEPATSFSSFTSRSNSDMATAILSLDTNPEDFWTEYVNGCKLAINSFADDWSIFDKSISDEDYRLALMLHNARAQNDVLVYGAASNLVDSFEEFKNTSPELIAQTYIAYNQSRFTPDFAFYLAKVIKENSEIILNGFYSEDEQEDAFVALFRSEYRKGVKAFIQSLKDNSIITDFEDLADVPALTSLAIAPFQAPDVSDPQIDTVVIGFTGIDDNNYVPYATDYAKVSIGDTFVLDLNGNGWVSYTAAAATVADVCAGLTSAINGASHGDWADVFATDNTSYISVTHNVDNTPFTLTPISLYSQIHRYQDGSMYDQLYLPANHPIYLSFAQAWLNDANAVDTNISVTKTFKGRAFIKDDVSNSIPAKDLFITVSDIDDLDNIVVLGTVKTDAQGYFSIAYTMKNSYLTEKNLRLSAKDEDGNEILITTSLEENLVVDAANGTFEEGTTTTDWNISLGSDVGVQSSESLGEELIENYSFDVAEEGWYTDYPQTTLFDNPNDGYARFGAIPPDLYTKDVLTLGKKYRVKANFTQGGAYSFTVKDTDDNTIYTTSDAAVFSAEFQFTATTVALLLQGSGGVDLLDFSVKEVNVGDNAYEGAFSPKFYMNDATPSNLYIFNSGADILLENNTDYILEGWVYTHGTVLDNTDDEVNSGIYLLPLEFSFSDLDQVNVYNGVNEILYQSNTIRKITPTGAEKWIRLYTKFNSGSADDTKFGLYLKGNITHFSDNMSVMIDSIRLTKDVSSQTDINIDVHNTSIVAIFLKDSVQALDAAIAQEAGASLPQITNVFPSNLHEGDQLIMDLNHEGSVTYIVQEGDSNADIVDGLFAAVTEETANVVIEETSPPSGGQSNTITPFNVLTGASFKFTKEPRNLMIDGDRGRFETSISVPADWGLSVSSIVSDLDVDGPGPFGDQCLIFELDFPGATTGTHEVINSLTPILLKKNTQYKISIWISDRTQDVLFEGNSRFYLLPSGYSKNEVNSIQYYEISPLDATYKQISTIFNSGNNESLTISLYMDLDVTFPSSSGGEWLLDLLRFEEASEIVSLIEYTATANTVANVVAGLTDTINEQTADTIIKIEEQASLSQQQEIRVIPIDVLVGAKFILQINDADTIEYIATDDTVEDVTAGLEAAINAATSGEWTKVTASDDTTHLTITANDYNVSFVVYQLGGHWCDVSASDVSSTHTMVQADDSGIPFTITQLGGAWATVTPTDNTSYLTLTADANNAPFDLYTKVVRAEEKAITTNTALENAGIILSDELEDSLLLKGIYTLKDILNLGGLKNNLDGKLTFQTTQTATVSLPQIVRVDIANVNKGDIFKLLLNGTDTVTYVATEATAKNVIDGLVAAIGTASGDWTDVTAANVSDQYMTVTADSNNTPFTLVQISAADTEDIKKLDAIASLYTIAADLGFDDQKTLEIIESMIEAGYTNALAISSVPKEDFINTLHFLAGDFNAAKMYELSVVRKELSRELVNKFAASQASYTISKSGFDGETQSKLYTHIKESCACDDCETAVSPLAYLTDLSNYVLKNLRSNGKNLDLRALENNFFQDLIELPASCEDVRNLVCQIRIAAEVMRRYVNSLNLTSTQKEILNTSVKEYVLNNYNFFLNAIGTSYEELRLISSEEDKIALAQRLGIDYESDPDFADLLLISETETDMAEWSDFNKVMNGEIQTLLGYLATGLAALDPTVTFTTFKGLSGSALKTKLLLLSAGGTFMTELGTIVHTQAGLINAQINNASIPVSFKEEQKWAALQHDLTAIFSQTFARAIQEFIEEMRRLNISFATLSAADVASTVTYLVSTDGGILNNLQKNDFWLPFAEALLSKVDAFTVDEADIEELFGLVDTRRDVFSDGAKRGDDANILSRWNLEGVKWGKNTDRRGYIYLEMDESDEVIELYRDSGKASDDMVGLASLDEDTLKFIITEVNDSGLSGELIVTNLDESAEIYISALPLILSMRLNMLRTIWKEQDAVRETPIIDPDLITPADIDFPYDIDTVDPVKAIDFWQERKDTLDAKYDDIKEAREAADTTATSYGASGSGSTQLDDPAGIAKIGDIIYISDSTNDRIQKLESGVIGTTTLTGLDDPRGLVATPGGKLIVANSGDDEIKQYTPGGTTPDWSFGSTGTDLGEFTNPKGIVLTDDNELFVTDDADGGRIQRFSLPVEFSTYTQTSQLLIEKTVAHAAGVKQVSTVTPFAVCAGDTFKLTLAGTGTVTYVALTSSIEEVVNGLAHVISLASWSSVTVANKVTYLEITATAANTEFTLTYAQALPFTGMIHLSSDRKESFFLTDVANNRILKLNKDFQVTKIYGTPHRLNDSLKAYYQMNETTGTVVRDSSLDYSFPHNGTVEGTYAWTSEGAISGNGLSLTNDDAFVTVATHADLDSSDFSERTVELWFNAVDKDSATHQVLYRQGDHTQGMCIYLKSGYLFAGIYGTDGGAWSTFLSTAAITSETTHHVAVVFSNTPYEGKNKFRAFIDGVEFTNLGQGNPTGVALEESTSPDGLTFGALPENSLIKFQDTTISTNAADNYFFDGLLDNIRVWNRALQDIEIEFLFNRIEDEAATLFRPGQTSVDHAGNLYVIDKTKYRAVKFDTSANAVTSYGGSFGEDEGQLYNALAVWSDGENVYIADQGAVLDRFQQFDSSGFVRVLDSNDPLSMLSSGIVTDSSGLVYLADSENDCIRVFDRDGVEVKTFTQYSEGGSGVDFNEPNTLLLNSDEDLVVVNKTGNKLILLDREGNTKYSLYSNPWIFDLNVSVAIDKDDFIYFIKEDNSAITRTRFPQAITSVTVPVSATLSDSEFDAPTGIAMDPDGNIWVADTGNNRVLKLNKNGVYLNDIGKSDNTTGTGSGEFNAPSYITTDESGNIYVSDAGNNRVQKFDNSGEHIANYTTAMFASLSAPAGLIITPERKLYVASAGSNDKLYVGESMQGMDAAIDEWKSGVMMSDILTLAQREKFGEDISADLEELSIDISAFRHLIKIFRFTEMNVPLTDIQLADFYNILVNAHKKGVLYSTWLNEEIAAQITLSQDHFRTLNDAEEAEVTLTNWRATSRDRRDWKQILSDRLEQEQDLINEQDEMISNAEDAYLKDLRNALVAASNFPGNSLVEKARYGGEKLLIDLLNDCCRQTSRVAQAIETLQNLIAGIRNGLILDKYPEYSISSTSQFDEEWKWMGSYASWRAAQFVFMYPENLLTPSYHSMQSHGFKNLIEDIRINPQVNAENIRGIAGNYYDYIDDITNLSLLASVMAPTLVKTDTIGIRKTNSLHQNYVHMVAKGAKTGSLYWSIVNANSTTLASTWMKIPSLKDPASLKVLSLEKVTFEGGKRFLVLFCLNTKDEKSKIIHVRYDLENNVWSEDVTEVDVPEFRDRDEDNPSLTAVFINNNASVVTANSPLNIMKDGSTDTYRITVLIYRENRMKFFRFNDDLSSLENITSNDAFYPNLNSYGRIADDFIIDNLYGTGNGFPIYRKEVRTVVNEATPVKYLTVTVMYINSSHTEVTYSRIAGKDIVLNNTPIGEVVNVVRIVDNVVRTTTGTGSLDRYYVFYYHKDDAGKMDPQLYVSVVNPNAKTSTISTVPNVKGASYLNMYINDKKEICILYQTGSKIKYGKVSFNGSYDSISEIKSEVLLSLDMNVSPTGTKVDFIFPDPSQLRQEQQFTAYKDNLKLFYAKKSTWDVYNFRYIEELYYYTPLTIALILQRRGFYSEALEWFRLVYDYTAVDQLKRLVYPGLNETGSAFYVVDDFDENRNLIVTAVTSTLKVLPNPSVNGLNISTNCGAFTVAKGAKGYIQYELTDPSMINLDAPEFKLKVLDPTFNGVSSSYVAIHLIARRNQEEKIYATGLSLSASTSWQQLLFTPKAFTVKDASLRPYVSAIRITIAEGDNSKSGRIFYIDDFSFRSTVAIMKPDNWMTDPLNPHAIASTRPGSYLRYTVMSLVSCMLDFADSEFTADTSESISRATLLYENAIDLMKAEGFRGSFDKCVDKINSIQPEFSNEWQAVWERIKKDLYLVKEFATLEAVIADIQTVLDGAGTEAEKIRIISNLVNTAKDNAELFLKISDRLTSGRDLETDLYMALQADPAVQEFMTEASTKLSENYLAKFVSLTKVQPEILLSDTTFPDGTVLAQLRDINNAITSGVIRPEDITGSLADLDEEFLREVTVATTGNKDALQQSLLKDLNQALSSVIDYKISFQPAVQFSFCLPPNPVPDSLRFRAELNLYKIRHCRNIAGVVRELETFAAPTDSVTGVPALNSGLSINSPGNKNYVPTIYRYQVLIERAKQLVQIAQQMEASMLASLEKLDAERYSLLKAKQDLSLSNAGMRLQDLRLKESRDGVQLAKLQKKRVDVQFDYYEGLISNGLLSSEVLSLAYLATSYSFELASASASFAGASPVGILGLLNGNTARNIAGGLSSLAQSFGTLSSISSTIASYERRNQEWRFQKKLAEQDKAIADEQIEIAEDQLAITGQEREIARMQRDNAEATIDFLQNKFTSAEMYEWMSNILERVYAYFLQQATATAKQAMVQLAFERQQTIPEYIQNDYWQAPVDTLLSSGIGNNKSVDRKGLTGSTRLLQDIYQLDQFAFDTDKRKFELTKTFSLASLAPAEFQRFKETGEITFETTLDMFDRDFPGHYLRLIKRVRTSVIALVNPVEGIKATLSNKGISNVVTAGETFRTTTIRRIEPESVALTASANATGLFELAPVQDLKLLPFENSGVETVWTFSMPKASNFFDYSTIADVLVTIEYTALGSEDYRSIVIRELDKNFNADRAFSFRNNFADQWYDLGNSSLTDTPMTVSFTTAQNDFPVNVRRPKIKNMTLFFAKSDDLDETVAEDLQVITEINALTVESLRFVPADGSAPVEAEDPITAQQGIISTRRGAGTSWRIFNGKTTAGTWEIVLPQGSDYLFSQGHITDILFVISYEGEASEW